MFSARRTLEAYETEERKPTCFCAGYKWVYTAVAGELYMDRKFSRLASVYGEKAISFLAEKHVMIFGLGGVGGYAAEAIARSGVGKITVVDFDMVNETNINRQLCAASSTLNLNKADVTAQRLSDINPSAVIVPRALRYTKDTRESFFADAPDYIIDAIDCVTDKIDLICESIKRNIPIISAMGAGNKTDASAFKVSDISKTKMCPLAKVMRKELGIRGIKHLKVVFSEESPAVNSRVPGSTVWVVGTAGLMLGGEVVKDLIKEAEV